jgi:regulator of CtrA degradation
MNRTTSLSRPIIEALYTEALVLADEVRAAFAQAGALGPQARRFAVWPDGPDPAAPTMLPQEAMARLALSTEGLKTTTRMMHVLAWLLNQRAFFSGELTANQVRRHGALPADRGSDARQVAMLDEEMRGLIAETERLHSRIARLDLAWRQDFEVESPARAFQRRIGRELGGG